MLKRYRIPRSHHPIRGVHFLKARLIALISRPLFLFLALAGNITVVVFAVALYSLEKETNPNLKEFIDALWWSFATVTTVGNGSVIPVTRVGKIMGIGLMIFGTALFSSFTALFAATLLEPELDEVEDEVHELERSIRKNEKT